MEWIDISQERPDDNERVLTWNKRLKEARIQVYNQEYECWDTEDGDYFEFKFDTSIIQYWARIKAPQTSL